MHRNLLLLILCIIISLSISSTKESTDADNGGLELDLVQVVFSNGERTPYSNETYPTDPYVSPSYYEPWGRSGQLTNLGESRARRLGNVLRREYDDFLGPNLSSDDIYAYSASRNSTQAMLRSVLESLLQRNETTTTVHSVPEALDELMSSRMCSKYQRKLAKIKRTDEMKKKLAGYDGLYGYVKKETGLSLNDPDTREDVLHQLYKLLESQRSMNLRLPRWYAKGVRNLLREFINFHYNLESYTEDLKRLNGGPLVRRFLDNMINERIYKIHLYSGEDHNVAAFSRAINKRLSQVPNYGSAIIIEKWVEIEDKSKNFVKFMIWTGKTEKLFAIQLKDCEIMCPLKEYKNIVANVLPANQELRCLLEDSSKTSFHGLH